MKEISHEEKIEFYKKYTNKDFQESLQRMENKFFKIGLLSIKIFLAIGLIGMFFTPWIAFAMLPGFVIPVITIAISNSKRKKAIESLTENIAYQDFLEMNETGELKKIAFQLSQQDLQKNTQINTDLNTKTKSKQIDDEKNHENDLTL